MTRIIKDPTERRAEIIASARELFETKGYADASMNDIMQALNIAKGTIYHYFRSKEELLESVVEAIIDEGIEKMREGLKASGVLKRFKRLVTLGNMAAENSNLLHQLHRPQNAAMHTRLMAVAISRQAPLYAQVIEEGCNEGLFTTTTPLESAECLLASLQFLTDMGVYPWPKEAIQRRMDAAPHIVEQMLGAKPGTFSGLFQS